MLLRFDPFRELDRMTEQVMPRSTGAVMAMDAVRRGHQVVLTFDLPGVDSDSIDLTVERDTLTVRADRRQTRQEGDEMLASERRFGTFTRQLLLGDALDTEKVHADYEHGVLTVTIPTAEQAKPRKIEVGKGEEREEIATTASESSGGSSASGSGSDQPVGSSGS